MRNQSSSTRSQRCRASCIPFPRTSGRRRQWTSCPASPCQGTICSCRSARTRSSRASSLRLPPRCSRPPSARSWWRSTLRTGRRRGTATQAADILRTELQTQTSSRPRLEAFSRWKQPSSRSATTADRTSSPSRSQSSSSASSTTSVSPCLWYLMALFPRDTSVASSRWSPTQSRGRSWAR